MSITSAQYGPLSLEGQTGIKGALKKLTNAQHDKRASTLNLNAILANA